MKSNNEDVYAISPTIDNVYHWFQNQWVTKINLVRNCVRGIRKAEIRKS